MKRIGLLILLFALILAGCAKSEPPTVATISPGAAMEMENPEKTLDALCWDVSAKEVSVTEDLCDVD